MTCVAHNMQSGRAYDNACIACWMSRSRGNEFIPKVYLFMFYGLGVLFLGHVHLRVCASAERRPACHRFCIITIQLLVRVCVCVCRWLGDSGWAFWAANLGRRAGGNIHSSPRVCVQLGKFNQFATAPTPNSGFQRLANESSAAMRACREAGEIVSSICTWVVLWEAAAAPDTILTAHYVFTPVTRKMCACVCAYATEGLIRSFRSVCSPVGVHISHFDASENAGGRCII